MVHIKKNTWEKLKSVLHGVNLLDVRASLLKKEERWKSLYGFRKTLNKTTTNKVCWCIQVKLCRNLKDAKNCPSNDHLRLASKASHFPQSHVKNTKVNYTIL